MPETVGTRLGDVAPGLELPPLQRQPGLHHWNRYAAVNDEFVDIHMDDEAGRAAGYPSAFGMGNLQWAYLHNLLESWLGEHGRVVALSCQFRGPNVRGQTVTAHGRVTTVEPRPDGEIRVVLAVWTDDQDGHRLAPGEATVIIGSPAGQERDTEVAVP
jgi:acyl dehydratase